MKNSSHAKNDAGKILVHDQGLGATGHNDVQRRAQELALIEGRPVANQDDLAQAKRELAGETLSEIDNDGDTTMDSLSRDPSDPPSQRGRQVPDFDGSEEEKNTERLVAEGVEEAQHDQMLAARRQRSE